MKYREFWIFKQRLDFDLGFERAMVAEYPHKDTPQDEHHIHTIDYAAYEDALKRESLLVEALEFYKDKNWFIARRALEQNRKLRE